MRGLWRLANVDKMWKTIWEKARNSQGFSVTLGRGGRVMRSSILYGWKIYLYMWDFIRIFVFQEKYIYESNK